MVVRPTLAVAALVTVLRMLPLIIAVYGMARNKQLLLFNLSMALGYRLGLKVGGDGTVVRLRA
jgi:hypothetical protein